MEHSQLARAAVKRIASRLRRCAERVETLSLREVGQRLARLLLEEARNHGTRTDGRNFGGRQKRRLIGACKLLEKLVPSTRFELVAYRV